MDLEGGLDGRRILVTGAAGALGRAVAEAAARAGARLALADIEAGSLGRAFGAETADRILLPVDLLDQAAVDAAVARAEAALGGLDGIASIAGGFHMGEPVHATPDIVLDQQIAMNLRSALALFRAGVPALKRAGGGRIVQVGAAAASHGEALKGAYVASKAALQRLCESMAAELRPDGIAVNIVLPTILDTPANRAAMPGADRSAWVPTDAAADAILFLLSPKSRALSGAAIRLGA